MTLTRPTRDDSSRSSSQELYHRASLTLERTRTPYHLKAESLTRPIGLSTFLTPDGSATSPLSRSESSESGTEADDEKGPLLKGLPAPPLRMRKGLRGTSPAALTPAASPLPTPPAFVEAREFEYFGTPRKTARKTPQAGKVVKDFEAYKARKRREIVRRCVETLLLVAIGGVIWTNVKDSPGISDWNSELLGYLLLPPVTYLTVPLRLTFRAVATGKSVIQAVRLGFHIPSRFDPGPLLYPVAMPVLIALSLFQRCHTFLPVAIVCGLSAIPPSVTATPRVRGMGDYVHWLITIFPIHASQLRFSHEYLQKPVSLKLSSEGLLQQEDLTLLYPLHQSLMTILGYLTTSSLDISELRLFSTAMIHLLLFARTPQAEILKAMLWLGGLCIFITCRRMLAWEVALARVPTWKLLRRRPRPGLVSQVDQAICVLLTRGHLRSRRRESSESDSERPPLRPISTSKSKLRLNINARASTTPIAEPMSAVEPLKPREAFTNGPVLQKTPRRNTFTVFERIASSTQSSAGKKMRAPLAGQSNVFLFFTLEQARVRKYAYAAAAYFCVAATILGPVRFFVGTRALSGHEPFGWAIGYLFGNIPTFRFWVVSNNLERWISLPARVSADVAPVAPFSIEYIRQNTLGPANTRLLICGYCVAVLFMGIFAVLRLTSVVEVDTRRKVFHGIMVAMLLPTIFVDPCFIALALSLVLAVFLLLDLFRASQLPPISKPLTTFLAPYVDGRDYRGPVIVSHIFLLIGCAIPLWLSLAATPRTGEDAWGGWDTPVRELSMVSGVVCVGMGDAAASLVGRRYGKTKWYWSGGKSLEGSLAFAVAVVCGLAMAWTWLRLGGWALWPSGPLSLIFAKFVFAGVGASLLESTLTAANDNVVVPIGLWLLVRGLNI
ncbi:uncharacterized protein PV06_06232 [Exophiala oligosperma]|uniref:dolichol kinase n=1 Tax=Exophiala oligosperma TaxID=215243 RepID=A0A0D2BZ07_9EURO|nr:uncharacterized protein PV06_06232 [Exophiala oligosperma]KIW42712.1 hypothetical protein PV06_06232 [Exophiala oligosperma]